MPRIDLDTRLPSRWRDVPVPGGVVRVHDHAEFLRDLRDHARDTYGAAHRAGLVSDEVLAALVKARALDLLARQIREVDGRALAVAVGCLLQHLTPEGAR